MNPTPEFIAEVDRHLAMRSTLGEDHPLAHRVALGLDTMPIDSDHIHRMQ